jgi:hypothetical protein
VFAAEVLRRLAVVEAARVERSGDETAPRQPAHADPFAAVAGALRAAVAMSKLGAGDPVPRLLSEVDAGIAGARNTLVRMGYDARQVAAAAVHFRERVGAALGSYADPRAGAVDGAAVSATHIRKERGSIELVTQDGDVVRIRFRSRESERVDLAGVQDAEGSALSARIATQHSARLKVAVHGELDAGELAAIENFLGGVNALATEFYDGDAEAAFAAAAELQADAQEIARYAVRLSLSKRFDVRAQVQGQPLPSHDRSPAAGPVCVGQVSRQAPSVGASVVTPSTPSAAPIAPSPDASDPATAPQVAQASGTPGPSAPGAAPARKASEDGLDSIRQFLQRVLAAAQAPVNLYGIALDWGVKIELTATLFEAARPEARMRQGADLLANVLDGAAYEASRAQGPGLDAAA